MTAQASFLNQVIVALIIGGLGGISVGGVLGFSAILLPQLGKDVTTDEKAWIGKTTKPHFISSHTNI